MEFIHDKGNLPEYESYILRPDLDQHPEKCIFSTSSCKQNPRACEPRAAVCQLSYEGRCREHGHETLAMASQEWKALNGRHNF